MASPGARRLPPDNSNSESMVETIFNGCEAALWMAFAVVVVLRFRTAAPSARRVAGTMALFFVLFGISDLIEMQTGAWWRPLGLLIFKGACLTGLIWCFVGLVRK